MAWKILVVDDDPYLRDIYQETLTDEGYEVDLADDGETGAAKLQQGGYDLCLLDIMLPKIDGLGVLESLTNNPPQMPNGPIIVLSNLSHEPLIEEAFKKGASSYLVKADLTPDVLAVEVKRLLLEETPTKN
jgi:two-component system OmpR family response regulator